MKSKLLATALGVALAVGLSSQAFAGAILIINGSSGTSEPGTTSAITTNLNNLHVAAGNTVTIADLVPGSFAGFDQVWDVRFSNGLAITAPQQTQYLSYLQGGGGMFVMGENSGFATRNNSVLALIAAAGGGNLNFVSPLSSQTVVAPFTGPNAIANVVYAAPGGVDSAGTGQFITVDGNGDGTGVAFGVGDLANASTGALTTIFDVNFMAIAESQNLTRNLINFVGEEVDPPMDIAEPGTLAVFGLGLVGLGFARRRKTAA
ncbi:MAG: PEP-CTERM sorting domain-containing protein [Rhodospirillaceae bacterium]|nr:PEP-CTERM sorting domain-containing protein [Rhodospirillaceae bacterium]MBT5458869.1 PEP-CTERM sorting domain-containing protein [Rhodospirillaceae bacterium]